MPVETAAEGTRLDGQAERTDRHGEGEEASQKTCLQKVPPTPLRLTDEPKGSIYGLNLLPRKQGHIQAGWWGEGGAFHKRTALGFRNQQGPAAGLRG